MLKSAGWALALLCLATACKNQASTDTQSAGTSHMTLKETEKVCGVVMMQKGQPVLQVADGNSEQNLNRVLQAEDGATLNMLTDLAKNVKEACIMADFSGKGEVSVTSVAMIQEPAKEATNEACGTLLMEKEKIMIQLTGDNSDKNGTRELNPEDGATLNTLTGYAKAMKHVCISADFSGDAPVSVISVSAITVK